MAREAKGLLIGESADADVVAKVYEILEAKDWVTCVNHVRTIHTSPRQIFVAISADLEDSISMGQGERLIENLETELRHAIPAISSIYIRPEKREDTASVENLAPGTA